MTVANAEREGRSHSPRWPSAVFLLCLGVSAWAFSIGWDHTIIDLHGFRQAQTAISIRYLLQGSSLLAYETPVLGPPWSIPFEFPLYQWLAALSTGIFGSPVDQSGRLVSVLCFYLSLFPMAFLLGQLAVRRGDRLLLLSLLLTSPLYLFWSRTVMVESLAFLLGLGYLALFVGCQRLLDMRWAILGAVAGALAAVVKPTTFVGFLLSATTLFVAGVWRSRSTWRSRRTRYVKTIMLFLILPLLIAALWIVFTERVRNANPLAREFLGPRAVQIWTLGSLELRGKAEFWRLLLWGRTPTDVAGHHAVILLLAPVIALARRRRLQALACLFLYLAVPMVFANLHAIHEYYPYANGIFLLGALAFGILGLLEGDIPRRRLGIALLLGLLGLGLTGYVRGYLRTQRRDHRQFMPIAEALQRMTHWDDVVLVYGWDWSSELPYLAQRRALMDRDERSMDHPAMLEALSNLERDGRRLGALVACFSSRFHSRFLAHAQARLGFATTPTYSDPICDIYPLLEGHGPLIKTPAKEKRTRD